MYLISIYFDEESNEKISSYMKRIGDATGNTIMTDGDVPPHITISSFDAKDEEQAKQVFYRIEEKLGAGEVFFVSAGTFPTGALFLSPVLNEYLQNLQEICYESMSVDKTLKISRQYRPYSWFPHATLAKKLTKEEINTAFSLVQNDFRPFKAKAEAIGLAKTNPYRDIVKMYYVL